MSWRVLALLMSLWSVDWGTAQMQAQTPTQIPTPTRQNLPQTQQCAPPEPATHRRPVWQGLGGWLFEPSDLVERLELCAPLHPYLDRLATALKRQGVTPLALVVPTRGSVHYALMGQNRALAAYDPGAAAEGYRAFLKELRRAGFIAPDLLEVAPGAPPFFFRRDHHWSPAGARRSAQRLAQTLQGAGLLAGYSPQPFITRRIGSRGQRGTLQKRVESCCDLRYAQEFVPLFKTVLEQAPASDLGGALFGDVNIPVALTGTSNSLRGEDKPDVNFSGFLREALGQEVYNTSFAGAGLFGSLEAYLLSEAYRASPPKVLVWETLYMNWHNNRALRAQERQIVPSVYGACAERLVTRRLESSWLQSISLAGGLQGAGLSGHDIYLHLDIDDLTLVTFALELTYRKGSESLNIVRTTRTPNSGDFFVELTGEFGALEGVDLKTLRPMTGGITLTACRVPEF